MRRHDDRKQMLLWNEQKSEWKTNSGGQNFLSSHDNMQAVINRTETKIKGDLDYCSRADLIDAFNDAFCYRNIVKCTYVHAKALTKTYTITHNSFPAPARANACRNAEVYDHHWVFALFITKLQLEAHLHGQHKNTHSLLHIYKHAYTFPLPVIYIDRK